MNTEQITARIKQLAGIYNALEAMKEEIEAAITAELEARRAAIVCRIMAE